jgi:hypothetical protein
MRSSFRREEKSPKYYPAKARTMHRVRTLKRVALGVVALVGSLLYVWFAAVRAVPGVRRRKAAARAARRR